MRLHCLRLPLLIALVLSCTVASAQEFSSLEERMSAAEFKAAGLDKLSEEELRALNDWIRGERALAPAAPAAMPYEDRRGLPSAPGDYDTINSRIVGEFRGWNGSETVIELENGQVWKSIDPAARLAVKLQNPAVELTPGFMSSWFIKVEGYSTRVRVKRIK